MDLVSKDQLDFFLEFRNIYQQILKDFNFNYKDDIRAKELLSRIMIERNEKFKLIEILKSFNNDLKNKEIILIYGCGPSLEESVGYIEENLGRIFFDKVFNIAADGASILLKDKFIPIDAVFTDLDGITKEVFNFTKYMIIHAHGDNINKLNWFMNDILEFKNIIGTVQVKPSEFTINTGGFTDGDRILYFLRKLLLPQHKLYLIGMDFNDIIGKFSKPTIFKNQKASHVKQKKLDYAVKLIKSFENSVENKLFLVNSRYKSKYFKNLTLREFEIKNIDLN